jgi:hypothetical protein
VQRVVRWCPAVHLKPHAGLRATQLI